MKKRKTLGVEELYRDIRCVFAEVSDLRRNLSNVSISICDALFSGFAIFALKFSSLLEFDKTSKDNVSRNLETIRNFNNTHIQRKPHMKRIGTANNTSINFSFFYEFSNLFSVGCY